MNKRLRALCCIDVAQCVLLANKISCEVSRRLGEQSVGFVCIAHSLAAA